MLKRLATLLLVLLPTLGIWAQTKAQYTERLDSIVFHWSTRKVEFAYNEKGQTERILYYSREENGWSLTNKREYYYDEQGNDTLRVIFDQEEGKWVILQQRYTTYGNHGEKLQTRTVQYARGEMLTQTKWDFTYNKKGKQIAATKYRTKKPGEWIKEMTVQNEYDAKGNRVKEVYAFLNDISSEKGSSIMHYDEEGRLTTQIDSVYNTLLNTVLDWREWRRTDYSYHDGKLSMMKEMLKGIDHEVEPGLVVKTVEHLSLFESLFDPQGNLVQTRRYRQVNGALRNNQSISYFYNLNIEGSSIMGYDFVPEILGLEENGKFHHKLIMLSEIDWDEDDEDDENNGKNRTRLYYSTL